MDDQFITLNYLDPIRVFRKVAVEDVIPCMGDLEERYLTIAREEEQRLGRYATEDTDPADVAEQALAHARDVGVMMFGLREGLKALVTAALFHLLEQQLQDLWQIRNGVEPLPAGLKNMLRGLGLDHWDGLEELEILALIANVAKHGEGRSANDLRQSRPILFQHPRLPESLTLRSPLGSPLQGEGIFISEAVFEHFADMVELFWQWVAGGAPEQGGSID